jgi:alpha-D-xyloside xylohydrolase
MVMQYPDDPNCQYLGLEYMLGDSLLVAPVFDQDDFKVYLPEGIWTEFMTGESINGGRWIRPQITIEDIPVYMKENSIVPMLEKVPFDMEAKYKELIVYISIRDEIDAEYFDDDFKGKFRASDTGVLTINTDMPAKIIVAYTSKPIETVIVNGAKKQAIKEAVNKYRIFLS